MKSMNQKRHHETKQHRLRKKFLKILDLPMDADGDALKITMVADTDLLIENHEGIVRYTDSMIRMYSAHGILRVEGNNLQLSELAAERAYVRGSVYGWCFEAQNGHDAL